MTELKSENIECYLQSVVGPSARVTGMKVLGKGGKGDPKAYGYGTPVLIDYEADGRQQRAVLHTVSPGPFGHEYISDRAGALLWDYAAFNHLPRHVRSIDVGAFRQNGSAVSLGSADEFFLLTEYAIGNGYVEDLLRMKDNRGLSAQDLDRADALCDYLVRIHSRKGSEPCLYSRHIRELIGHSECIMGLIDSYPSKHEGVSRDLLREIERLCVDWRWRLKDRVHRLRQVHGDFHPWNILFGEGAEFTVLDRSRGEWGDPADDVCCLTMNYVFFSLQRSGYLDGNFESLFLRFWERYLANSGDHEILEVAAPFFAFRGLVMAHPIWYPNLSNDVRERLFRFVLAVLNRNRFDPQLVNEYCQEVHQHRVA